MEKKYLQELIRHKRKQRDLLLDILVGVAGGIVFAVGMLLILVLGLNFLTKVIANKFNVEKTK